MRKQHNLKSVSGFTYTSDIISAINADNKHALPPVTHVDIWQGTRITPELVSLVRHTSQGVPVFHRMKHEIEVPSCLGTGLDLLAS